jgi:N-acetylmuramoyl-L-alanine amidase/Bacterial SH3 domain
MAWRGRTTALELKTIADFKVYMHGLDYRNWRPSGIVQHNTASPTLYQWWHSVPPAERMQNLISYYRDEMGWSAGPHVFVDGVSFWVLTDLNVSGVHSPSWNATRLGIEMVGDYDSEDDEHGMGAQVMEMTVALFGECCAFFGWEVNNSKIKQHKEDPATDHDCPGRNVVKAEFLTDVTNYMGDGGDHTPVPPQPTEVAGEVYGVAEGDTLNIRASASTSAPVIGEADNGDLLTIVGDVYNGSTRWFRARFGAAEGTGVAIYGWASAAYVRRVADTVGPAPEEWHDNVTATVFGQRGDDQDSAYPDIDWIDASTVGVSLPYKWRNEPRPVAVVVQGPAGTLEASIVDVGPWNIDDPYVLDTNRRPMAEKQYRYGQEAQNGQVPNNDAGIDLTVPVADAVGIDGKGKVRWRFK